MIVKERGKCLRTSMSNRERDIAYGIHSKIPYCCILFYVNEWEPNFENKWRGTTYNKALDSSPFNYVACPQCFYTDNLVKIRICDEECGQECGKKF